TPVLQLTHEVDERHLGGVGHVAEHGFAEKHTSERHSVQAAHELSVVPRLDGVGQAEIVQATVGFEHGGGEPGAAGVAARAGAGATRAAPHRRRRGAPRGGARAAGGRGGGGRRGAAGRGGGGGGPAGGGGRGGAGRGRSRSLGKHRIP